MTTTRKYYARIPEAFSVSGKPYWLELHGIKSLTSAKANVDRALRGIKSTEIAVSIDSGNKTVVTKKNNGEWEVVNKSKSDERTPDVSGQIHYHLGGKWVSREDFYKYGFQHEKTENRTNGCTK